MPSAKDLQELEAMQAGNPFDVFFVAEDSALGVVGCAGIVRVDEKTCELRKLYLLKKFRGQGIGKLLFEACFKEAATRHYDRIRFEVHSAMHYLHPFLSHNAFVLDENERPRSPSSNQVYFKTLHT